MTLEVPPKKEIIVYAPLTAKQEAFYTAVVNKSIAKMLGQEKVTRSQSWELVRAGVGALRRFSPHSAAPRGSGE